MTLLAGRPRSWRFPVVAVLVVFGALLAVSSRAEATELLYWNNYTSNGLAFANVDGTGGGAVNVSGVEFEAPEGMAYDSTANRIYVGIAPKVGDGQIAFVNLDGSGAGLLPTPGVSPYGPEGIAIDPATRTVYWINTGKVESIGWAKLDGSGGGLLNTAGATLENAYRLAFDPVAGRVYWGNAPNTGVSIAYANANNSGGGNLNIAGVKPGEDVGGLAVDPAGGRIYWVDEKWVSYANLNNSGGGTLDSTGPVFGNPYGLAFDPALGKLYWANYDHKVGQSVGAFGVGNLAGGGGGIDIATAPLDGPQDPLILKSPVGAGLPAVSRAKKTRSLLSCSSGTWAPDLTGSSVYQAPRSFAYQWQLKGKPVAGATSATLSTKKPGGYKCIVTAVNQAGSATQSSKVTQVKAAKLKLTAKAKKVSVRAGGTATFKVKTVNQGDLKSKLLRLCVVVPKSASKVVRATKCKKLKVKAHGKPVTALIVRTTAQATGIYNLKIVVRGGPGKAAKAKLQIVG